MTARGQASCRRRRPPLSVTVPLVILLVMMAGCAASGPEAPAAGHGVEGREEVAGDDGFPIVWVDEGGRTITIPRPPQRIIALGAGHVETLFALGLGHRLVGIDALADYPPQVAGIPRVGDTWEPDLARMLELEPDLFLATRGAEDIAQQMNRQGIPAVIAEPATFTEVLDHIAHLGRITGAGEEAQRLAADMHARYEAVVAATAALPPVSVFVEVWPDPLLTAGPGSLLHDLIMAAGGVNVAHDSRTPWPQVDLAAVVRRDPQVVIVLGRESLAELTENRRTGWSGIRAVQEGRLYHIDEDVLTRAGPRLVEGLESLARALHPEVIP